MSARMRLSPKIYFIVLTLKLSAKVVGLLALFLNPYLIRSLARKLVGSLRAGKSSRVPKLRVIYVGNSDLYYGGLFEGEEFERLIMLGGFSLLSSKGRLYEELIDINVYWRVYRFLINRLDDEVETLFKAKGAGFSDFMARLRQLSGRDEITNFLMQGLGLSLSKKRRSCYLILPLEGRAWERAICSGCSNADIIIGYVPTVLTEKNRGFYHFSSQQYPGLYPRMILVPGLLNREFLREHGFENKIISWFYMRDSGQRTCKIEKSDEYYDLLVILSGTLLNDIRFVEKISQVSGSLSICCRPSPRAKMSRKLADLINSKGFALTGGLPNARIILSGSSTFCLENAQLISGKLVYVMHMGDRRLLTPKGCIDLYKRVFTTVDYRYVSKSFINEIMREDKVNEASIDKEDFIMQMIGLRPGIRGEEVFELLNHAIDSDIAK